MSIQDVKSPFLWGSRSMDVKEFLQNYKDKLPVVIRITEGYDGADQMLSCSTDEMFWIYNIHKQLRIVAKDQRGNFLSIPIQNQFKFQPTMPNETDTSGPNFGPPVPLETIMQDIGGKFGSKFMFEKNQQVPYFSELDVESSTQFGTLEFVDWYHAQSLLGCSIQMSREKPYELFPIVNPIPVYVPIKLSVAFGFRNQNPNLFKFWIDYIKTKITEHGLQENFKLPETILVFNKQEHQHTEDYEYLRPTTVYCTYVDVDHLTKERSPHPGCDPHPPSPVVEEQRPKIESSPISREEPLLTPLPPPLPARRTVSNPAPRPKSAFKGKIPEPGNPQQTANTMRGSVNNSGKCELGTRNSLPPMLEREPDLMSELQSRMQQRAANLSSDARMKPEIQQRKSHDGCFQSGGPAGKSNVGSPQSDGPTGKSLNGCPQSDGPAGKSLDGYFQPGGPAGKCNVSSTQSDGPTGKSLNGCPQSDGPAGKSLDGYFQSGGPAGKCNVSSPQSDGPTGKSLNGCPQSDGPAGKSLDGYFQPRGPVGKSNAGSPQSDGPARKPHNDSLQSDAPAGKSPNDSQQAYAPTGKSHNDSPQSDAPAGKSLNNSPQSDAPVGKSPYNSPQSNAPVGKSPNNSPQSAEPAGKCHNAGPQSDGTVGPRMEQCRINSEFRQNVGKVEPFPKPVALVVHRGVDWTRVRDINDIPVETDMEELTVEQVARCMELLKISPEKVRKFKDADVDGSLLMSLDAKVLVSEFGLSSFEATKLTKFATGKWRPKVSLVEYL